MSKRWVAPATALAVSLAFTAAQASERDDRVSASQGPPTKARVLVRDNYFEPRSAVVADGGLVTWKWRGTNRHSIRFTKVPAGASRKGARARDEGRWRRKFHKPGVYRYVCTVFAGMRGSVTIRPEPEPES